MQDFYFRTLLCGIIISKFTNTAMQCDFAHVSMTSELKFT